MGVLTAFDPAHRRRILTRRYAPCSPVGRDEKRLGGAPLQNTELRRELRTKSRPRELSCEFDA
jgi:hypothetical protein